jgi:putative aldouronate transport system permease protein
MSASPPGPAVVWQGVTRLPATRTSLGRRILASWQLYVFLVPAILFIGIFRYGPMFGLQLAFKSYNIRLGILKSPWIGFAHFQRLFSYYRFSEVFLNSVILAVYKLAACFPLPIILAISLNEVRSVRLRRTLQTITYAPYFISVVIVVGMMMQIFSPHYGIYTMIRHLLGLEPIDIMSKPVNFRHLFVWTDVWQLTGYSAILYIAALAAVPPELYEAADIDGASKFQRIRSIDIPSLLPTATILLILEAGRMMDISFEKVILLQSPINLRTSEVLTTYVYKVGLLDGYFDLATAGGLINSVVNFLLLLTVNTIARRMGETSLW